MSATIASWCARLLGASLALCVLFAPFHLSTASAQDEGVSESLDTAARALFEDGRRAFETGDFETALERFQQAYEISHRVPLLWNIAATLDRLRRDEEALEMFEQYIAAVPDAPNRDEVNGRIRVLREAVETRRAEEAARDAEAARLEEERRRMEEERRARDINGTNGDDPTDAPASSGGITPVVFIVAAGLTAVAGGILIWSGIDTLTANDNYVAAAEANRPIPEIEGLYHSALDAQTRTNVMIGVTSALAVTSLVLVFFTDWGGGGGGESESTSVSLLPSLELSPAGELGGAGLTLGGRF